MSYKIVARVFVVAMVGIHAFFLWSVRDRIARGDPDFTVFYSAARILRAGRGVDLYDPRTQLEDEMGFAKNSDIRKGPLPYIHPPYEALLFVPMTFLPYSAAFALWEGLNLLLLFAVCWILQAMLNSLRGLAVWMLMLLCLGFFPVFANFHQGQDAILLLLIVVLAFRCLEQQADFAAGCWLGLGLFKYHLILPLVLILWIWRGRRLIWGFGLVGFVAAIVSFSLVGWHGAMQYPAYAWQVVSQPVFGGLPFRRLPNLLGLLAGWSFMERGGWPTQVVVLACSCALFGVVAGMKAKAQESRWFRPCFSCAVIAAVLLGYSTNTYDLCLLILPLALVSDFWIETSDGNLWSRSAGMLPAAMICLSPVWFFLWMRWERINLMAVFLLWWLFAVRSEIAGMGSKRLQPKGLALI